MTNIKKHLAYYAALAIFLTCGAFLIMQSQYGRGFQILSAVGTAVSYVMWGIVHHHTHHNITTKIVVEYVLVGSLGIAIVLFLLFARSS